MFSNVCNNPRDPAINSLDLNNFSLDDPRSLVREYVGSTNHILKQKILDEFHNVSDDDKHNHRRKLF